MRTLAFLFTTALFALSASAQASNTENGFDEFDTQLTNVDTDQVSFSEDYDFIFVKQDKEFPDQIEAMIAAEKTAWAEQAEKLDKNWRDHHDSGYQDSYRDGFRSSFYNGYRYSNRYSHGYNYNNYEMSHVSAYHYGYSYSYNNYYSSYQRHHENWSYWQDGYRTGYRDAYRVGYGYGHCGRRYY